MKRGFGRRRVFDRLGSDRGASLVEYAIVCVISLTMLFGIIDFGRALYAYHFVSNAARTATRWAAVNGSDCATDSSCAAPATTSDIDNYVKNIVPLGVDVSKITVNPGSLPYWPVGTTCTRTDPPTPSGCTPPVCSTTQNAPGCTVQVEVQYVFNFLVPLVRSSSITMTSTSQMVIAH